MKPNIHPDYHDITIVFTDGTEVKTRSTYGKPGGRLQLDVDIKTHPAWTKGGNVVNANAGSIAKFNSKFGNLSFGGKKAAVEEKKDNKEGDK